MSKYPGHNDLQHWGINHLSQDLNTVSPKTVPKQNVNNDKTHVRDSLLGVTWKYLGPTTLFPQTYTDTNRKTLLCAIYSRFSSSIRNNTPPTTMVSKDGRDAASLSSNQTTNPLFLFIEPFPSPI